MTNSNDTSTLDHGTLADSELNAVTGGLVVNAIIAVLIGLLIPSRRRRAESMA